MSGFFAHCATPDQVRTVFPLVREAMPGVDLKTWVRFAKPLSDPRRAAQGGIIVVTRLPRPLPCGMFLYRREQDLAHGPILVAEHFIAMDILDLAPVVLALTTEMEALALRLQCGAIRAVVRERSAHMESGLVAAGLRAHGATLFKRLAATD